MTAPGYSRRRFLALAGAGSAAVALAGCSTGGKKASPVPADGAEVKAAEEARKRPGTGVKDVAITAAPLTVDLGGISAATWAYGSSVPGAEIRMKAGDPHAVHRAGGGPFSEALNSGGGDVSYPLFLLNGRHSSAPVELTARKGERIRFRIINAAADTPFRVAVGATR